MLQNHVNYRANVISAEQSLILRCPYDSKHIFFTIFTFDLKKRENIKKIIGHLIS
jgi:hypothetical protein